MRQAQHPEHHEQRDRVPGPVRDVQVPGGHVLHRGLHRVVPRDGQRDGEAHQGTQRESNWKLILHQIQ